VETEAVAEQITHDTLCGTVNTFLVCLQQVHDVKGSQIEHMIIQGPGTHKISMKVSFHSRIISFCALENYEQTIHQNCCVFFGHPAFVKKAIKIYGMIHEVFNWKM